MPTYRTRTPAGKRRSYKQPRKGTFNRKHRHGVLRKKFATPKRAPGRAMTGAITRKPGHGRSVQRALGSRPHAHQATSVNRPRRRKIRGRVSR